MSEPTDIVERLRSYEVQDMPYWTTFNLEDLLRDAANEIEQLREKVKETQ